MKLSVKGRLSKRRPGIVLILLLGGIAVNSYGQGISFSYLVPRNGYVSAPVSPLSVRGLGYYYGPVGVETGGSVYSMSGLGMKGLPFETDQPLTGPHFSLLVPAELVFKLEGRLVSWKLRGGGAGIWHINPRINEGNLDRALRDYEGWVVANSNMEIETSLGWGWIAGTSFEWHLARDFSISTEVSYLSVPAKASLSGSYTGGNQGLLETRQAQFADAAIDLSGLELSIGVILRR